MKSTTTSLVLSTKQMVLDAGQLNILKSVM